MLAVVIVVCVLVVSFVVAVASVKKCETCNAPIRWSDDCATCGAPTYSTATGRRHKPGHAPSDRHAAAALGWLHSKTPADGHDARPKAS